jgi:hypothetical protein
MNRVVSTRYLVSFVAIVGVGFLLVAGFGYYAGPAHLYSSRYEQGMAEILVSGQNIGNPGTYDQGLLQKHYVAALTERRDVIVLGSSRSMYIRQHLFPGRTFFNNMLTSATIQDYLAIYELHEERGLAPSVVVIDASPYLLNKKHRGSQWTSLRDEYLSMASRLGLAAPSSALGVFRRQMTELLSWPYFRASVANVFATRGNINKATYFATPDPIGILYDGSVAGGGSLAATQVREVEARATRWAKNPLSYGGLDDFTELDKVSVETLETFIEYLCENNVEVVFYLAPYHPSAYEILAHSDEYRIIVEVEAYYRDLAVAYGIPVVGSYDPVKSSCTKEEFFDGEHPLESAVNKVFSWLDCAPARKCQILP